MKNRRYIIIDVDKRYEAKAYILRYMHLLEIMAPDRYELNLYNLTASIEDKRSQLTVADFSDNPFKREL